MAVLPLYRCMRFPSRPPRRQAFLILWRQADAGEVVISSSHCGNFGGGVARRFALVVLTRCAEDIPVAFGHHRQCKRPVAAIAVVSMAHGHAPLLCIVLTMTRGKTGRKAARSPQGTGQHGHVERAGHGPRGTPRHACRMVENHGKERCRYVRQSMAQKSCLLMSTGHPLRARKMADSPGFSGKITTR